CVRLVVLSATAYNDHFDVW
nr:immunoglobulin heavy chain junction region [Macaca mulatta]